MTTEGSNGRGKPAERQREIAEYVVGQGSATASSLAELFGVSLMTVHRDLDELERRGMVRKHRGGVTAQPSSVFESHLSFRKSRSADAKRLIAREARKLVEPGMAVMLDDSTSALALAESLHDAMPLTVITNFLEIIRLVIAWPEARVFALGGEYNAAHDSFLGFPCVEAISGLRADILFASTSTVDRDFVYHQEQDIVFVKRAMLTAVDKKVLLVDHTKLGRPALHRLAPLSDFDLVITDEGASPETLRLLRDNKIEVTVASSVGPPSIDESVQ